jgi:DNA repair exonuclease SbcCD ATPase subunit/predicted phosphodiesterase
MRFRYIYHISDIHIRLYSRRNEYQHVFQELYRFLREKDREHLEASILVVTGDVLHNKIDMQPECIMTTYEFLKELGSIMTTVVIAGNHDALLNNRDRVDSLTSVLHDRHPSGVFYYDKTGTYRHGNLVFVVNSLLDDRWIRASEVDRENPDDLLVGLYHGQIYGWKNCHGYVSESGEKEVSDFDGCDLVLLGDIHKHQYMNKDKTMAYAGSLISQNFGETDEDHGVLVWDLDGKTSSLHRLDNPYAYREFRVEERGEAIYLTDAGREWPLESAPMPPHGNVKAYLPVSHGLHVPSVVRKRFPGTRFHFQVLSKKEALTAATATGPDEPHDREESLIREYVRSRWPHEDTTRLQTDLMKDFYENHRESSLKTTWEIEYLYFENLFGYGDENRIDFSRIPKHTVTGIFGKNSAGKSTLIDILSFMLYGKITRSSHGNSIPKEVVHFSEKSGWGEVCLRIGSSRYVLRKVCKRAETGDRIKIVETLYEIDERGNRVQLTEEQRRRTDKVVQGFIGGYKSFLYTHLFLQQREESFRDMKQAARKDFLYELFGLDFFEKYRKTKEDQSKTVRAEANALKKRIEDHSESMWVDSVARLEKVSLEKKAGALECRATIDLLVEKRESCFAKLKPCEYPHLVDLEREQRSLESELASHQQKSSDATAEKQRGLSFMAEHNIKDLETRLHRLSLTRETHGKGEEPPHPLVSRYSPYHSSTATHKEWRLEYAVVKKYIASSSAITQEWNAKEATLTSEIRDLLETKPSYDPSMLLSETMEWTRWTEEYTRRVQERETHAEELSRIESEAPDMVLPEDSEERLLGLEKAVEERHRVFCRYEMARQQETMDVCVQYNKECRSCMSNPHYLERKERAAMHKKLKAELQEKEKRCRNAWDRISTLFPIQEPAPSWEDLLSRTREFFSEKRGSYRRCLARKEAILEAQKTTAAFEAKYKNTSAYRAAKKVETRVAKLEKQSATDPLRAEYDKMLRSLENLEAHATVEDLWKRFLEQASDQEDRPDKLQDLVRTYRRYESSLPRIDALLAETSEDIVRCRIRLDKLTVQAAWLEENKALQDEIKEHGARADSEKKRLGVLEQEHADAEKVMAQTLVLMEEWKKDSRSYETLRGEAEYLERLVSITERDGLPLFLLRKKLPEIEADVNALLSPFLDKKLVLYADEKDVAVGIEMSSKKISNYLGGMESFIIDLSLKLGFSKFANLPRSNFFIIDEGISVMDQERVSNISHLFDFLSNITDHVLLISHLPAIKDFVSQSVEIVKDEATQKSRVLYH